MLFPPFQTCLYQKRNGRSNCKFLGFLYKKESIFLILSIQNFKLEFYTLQIFKFGKILYIFLIKFNIQKKKEIILALKCTP